MIKTIDTNEITEKMFQAFRDNYVDATRCIFAVLAAATAVEPAQRCNCCGYLVTDSEHKGCLRAAKQEPAQAVPVAWLRPDKCHVDFHKHPGYLPLYTVPPAIDDETCKMALLIREAVNKGIFQGAIRRDAISILSRLTIFHGGENDSSR